MKSILQEEKRCYFCGSTVGLEDHHVFMNSLRKKSERLGLKAWLCHYHHRDTKHGVHGCRALDLELKRKCQERFEETHGHDEWMMVIGRNYLEDDDED